MPRRRGWHRWLPNSLVAWGGALAAVVALLAVAAPLWAPYDPAEQLDPAAARFRPPGTELAAVELADGRWLLAERVEQRAAGLWVERRGEEQLLAPKSVRNASAKGVTDRRIFFLGSDRFGRDLWSRLVYGARVSLLVGLLAVATALSLGIAVGAAAAVSGGWLDAVLMRAVDGLLAFPRLFLVVALAGLTEPGLTTTVLVLGGTGWMGVARLARAEILAHSRRDFVLAARAAGASPSRVLFRHLLPNSLTPILIDATLRLGDTILLEAGLSFLGLGIQPPTPSWGNMIAEGRDALGSAWWAAVFPGAAIAWTVVAANLLGEGLRDALDPRAVRRAPAWAA